VIAQLKAWARALKQQLVIAWHAARDPATPWWMRAWWGFTLAYALSPIDLIPDFIPVLGLLDDLILLPLFIWLGFKWTPPEVLARARAQADAAQQLPSSKMGAAVIALLWALGIIIVLVWALRARR
jgi:uncharacterized membrane protein YkvA (DUF1232 family)